MKVRYLIKFTKESNIKFIAHLDLMRTIQKVIRRTDLPVEYSKGFNPHIEMSIAQPLSVGVYSSGEYMDLILEEDINEQEVIDRLNAKTASGIKFLLAKKFYIIENERRLPQSMALIDACRYTIMIKYENVDNLEDQMEELLNNPDWTTIKKSKKGERKLNIRPLIFDFKYWIKDNNLVINTQLRSGSKEHLSADVVVRYIKEKTTNVNNKAFVDIRREEMYFYKEDKLLPLYEIK